MQATLDAPVLPPLPELEAAKPAPEPSSLFRRVLQDRGALLGEIVAGKSHNLTRVALVGAALTALGGLALGVSSPHPQQILLAAAKTPLIAMGALLICFPAFYIFAALQGSQLSMGKALRMFVVGMGLRGAIIAGLAPLLLFFSTVGSPYGFLLVAGLVTFGLAEAGFLHTLQAGVKQMREAGDSISLTFTRGWMLIYLAVVMQFTWSLRPIIGLCNHEADVCHWMLIGGGPGGNMFTHIMSQVAKLVA